MKGGKSVKVKVEVKERQYAGKVKVAKIMKEVTKEVLGRSWDNDTCKFAFDVVTEALQRACLIEGGIWLPGFIKIKIDHRPPAQALNVVENQVMERPGYNICTAKPTKDYKEKVKYLDTWFYDKEVSEEVLNKIKEEADKVNGGEG